MAPKFNVQLKQEEFDEAVKANMEDFDMEADEAVASAVEEFTLQGYNLEGVIKTSSGGDTDSHPVAVATRALLDATNNAASGTADIQQLQQLVAALQQSFKGSSGDELEQAVAVAAKEGTVTALLAAAEAATEANSSSSSSDSSAALITCLRTLKPLMTSPAARATFLTDHGPELLQQLIRNSCSVLTETAAAAGVQQQQQLAAAAAGLAEAASWQDEEAKCRFMDMGFAADLLKMLQLLADTLKHNPTDSPAAAAAAAAGAAAGALRAFTTADDDRPPASKAFMHARLLAGQPLNALQVLLPVLQQLQQQQQGSERRLGPLMQVVAAVRQISANDEICKSFADAGGVSSLHNLLSSAVESGPPELVRSAAAALRQLANSDQIKQQLAAAGVMETIIRAARVYTQPAVREQLLGMLAALVLRMPAISSAAAEAGAVDLLVEVLAAAPAMAAEAKALSGATANGSTTGDRAANPGRIPAASTDSAESDDLASKVFGVGVASSNSNGSAAAVQRQACMAVRNMVVRNPELRPGFLAANAEELLRAVKTSFPGSCKDVASAALRDLGLNNYN